jgi:AP-1 complex subunit sigma 1/2
MIHFALLFSRQGKVRLSKYYKPYSQRERAKLVKEAGAYTRALFSST